MSRMKKEIARSMTNVSLDGDMISAHFVFPEGFIGFQGHFPEKKVLPGVCQIQCVLSMIEAHVMKPVTLKEIVLVKFFAPIVPGEEIVCQCRDDRGSNGADVTVKAAISRGDQKVSEMKLRVNYARV